ncbi:MAG: helix-hairpin-helix domain-containing protein [Acidobacteriota bacterium]|nr:helix-hairpin-helix domain-containing protein [Blastocatellia bacterium]MDW8238294.1 helix-hairpin-helix domain-containing protein [Acidobacteriota bacterium]
MVASKVAILVLISLLFVGIALGVIESDRRAVIQHAVGQKPDWSVFLPEGDGRTEVVMSCSGCHDFRQIATQRKTSLSWSQTVQNMVTMYGAPVDPQDVPLLVGYLARHFGEENPIDRLPLNINTASVEALARVPGISSQMAHAIVEARQSKRRFTSVEQLARLAGFDKTLLEQVKPYLVADK